MTWHDIDLAQLASVAGATVGLVVATAILLSWLTARYSPNFDRYRALCEEFRRGPHGERRDNVREEIFLFQKRLHWINRGSCILCVALLCSLVGIVCATLSILIRDQPIIIIGGLGSLFLSLVLFGLAIMVVLVENRLDLQAITNEAQDLHVSEDEPHQQNGFARPRRIRITP
ncbi:MAG: DUF2721 domain-containing protein [Gemmataceae bacterium]